MKKEIKAWAVMDKRGKLEIDSIQSQKSNAVYYMDYYGLARVVRVTITYEVEEGSKQ